MQKIFLDWALLAQSRVALAFGSSSFAGTAISYSRASVPKGETVRRLDFEWKTRQRGGQNATHEAAGDEWWRQRCRADKATHTE